MIKKLKDSKSPRILIYDIETAPILGYTWGIWEQNVIEIVRPWFMMSFAYKWLGEDKVHVVSLPDFADRYSKNSSDDYDLVNALRNLLDEADIIVAHNGDEFDIKKVNARLIYNNIAPPSPCIQIDTKKIAKKYFKFESNSLKDLAKFLKLPLKMDTGGFSLWTRCMAGDMSAWKTMCKYNKQDVVVLERIYLKFIPWHRTHPNVSINGILSCPKCSSVNVHKRGFSRTITGITYQRIICNDCTGWSQFRNSEKEKSELK